MEERTKGSWLVHHANKLQGVTSQANYENTFLAGKAGILLSAISANRQTTLSREKVQVLATAASVNTTFELPALLKVLKKRGLIDTADSGIAVLGVTTSTTLQHTSKIFDELQPSNLEQAALELAESASQAPKSEKEIHEELGDLMKLSNTEVGQLLYDAEQIGYVDAEKLSKTDKLYFNGNLFRRDATPKIKAVLDSLSAAEQAKLRELSEMIRTKACVPMEIAQKMLGDAVFSKISAIGFFDVNVVSNSTEESAFLTLPSAFSKYSSSIVDDAFDLAKAFVSSITYGMLKSNHARGKITMVKRLLGTLISGDPVGPVNAIQEDYKVLELKGVVKVIQGTKKGRYGPMLKLLKKEVGELALQVIEKGDVSEHSLEQLPGAAVTRYSGPEANRTRIRRSQVASSPKATNDMLSVLRTGGGF